MKKIKIVIAVLLVVAIGAGAGVFFYMNMPEQKIKGTWENDDLTYVFDDEGKVNVTYFDTDKLSFEIPFDIKGKASTDGTYTIEKGEDATYLEIDLKFSGMGIEFSQKYKYVLEFEEEEMILTIIDKEDNEGEEIVLTKVE